MFGLSSRLWTAVALFAVVAVTARTVVTGPPEEGHESNRHHWSSQKRGFGGTTTYQQNTKYVYPFGIFHLYQGETPHKGDGGASDTVSLHQNLSWVPVGPAKIKGEFLGNPETTFWVTLSLILVLWLVFAISCIICKRENQGEGRRDCEDLDSDNSESSVMLGTLLSSVSSDDEDKFVRRPLLPHPALPETPANFHSLALTSSKKSSVEAPTPSNTETDVATLLFEAEKHPTGAVPLLARSIQQKFSWMEAHSIMEPQQQKISETIIGTVAATPRGNNMSALIWFQLQCQQQFIPENTKRFLGRKTGIDGRICSNGYCVEGWWKGGLVWPLHPTKERKQATIVNTNNIGEIITVSYASWRSADVPFRCEVQ